MGAYLGKYDIYISDGKYQCSWHAKAMVMTSLVAVDETI